MGGSIVVESEIGYGSSFNLFFDTISYLNEEEFDENNSVKNDIQDSHPWSYSNSNPDD